MEASTSWSESPYAALWWWPEMMTQAMQAAWQIAPQNLNQSILRGWTFGNNVTINEQNSSAPDAERDIVAQESYGRQLGRVTDALAALIAAQPAEVRERPEMLELMRMREKIEGIKRQAAAARLARLKMELEKLKKDNSAAYEALWGAR